ncbi:MAG: glycosyltransferase [Deltaproteobacteria bacterium]|nr:glycosyltransferase [Deltaproteobacteria bacterium]
MGADPLLLSEETVRALEQIRSADILVGIPSYNNARTIGHVVRAVCAGLAKYFPSERAVLVNSDGGSQDETPDVVRQAGIEDPGTILVAHPVSPVHKITTPYHGVPGKGSAFRTIFRIAELLGARACAVVDSDLRSITPEWVELLLRPVCDHGFDFVAPLYRRHKYDGTITNSIVYPLTRALYGKKVRQPIGGDFGFSGRLAAHYLTKDVWDSDVARYGIDIWMTTTAIANGFRVCQAYLGAKIHDPKDPAADLTGMLVQVVGSVFDLMETYEHVWTRDGPSEEVPLFGFQYDVGLGGVSLLRDGGPRDPGAAGDEEPDPARHRVPASDPGGVLHHLRWAGPRARARLRPGRPGPGAGHARAAPEEGPGGGEAGRVPPPLSPAREGPCRRGPRTRPAATPSLAPIDRAVARGPGAWHERHPDHLRRFAPGGNAEALGSPG